ncbi:MAG TPA: glycosyl hydrolase, partial [Flavobacteriales bacterium]|nr:glycosyl hydrolase [Flavobacteriales bacterium]
MIPYFTYDLILHLIIFQTVIFLIFVSNVLIIRYTRRYTPPDVFPKVSILVPARNEEKNIAKCVKSLLALDYPDFEVLVLDD